MKRIKIRYHFMIATAIAVLLLVAAIVLKSETNKMKGKIEISEKKTRSVLKKIALLAIDKKYEEIIYTSFSDDYIKTLNSWNLRKICEEARDLHYLSVIKKINDSSNKEFYCFPPIAKDKK